MTNTLCMTNILPMVENTPPHAAFAARLTEQMKARNVSITDLMKIASCTYEMARRYTLGTAKPRDKRLEAIAGALNVSASYLSFGDTAEDIAPSNSYPKIEEKSIGYHSNNSLGLVDIDNDAWLDEFWYTDGKKKESDDDNQDPKSKNQESNAVDSRLTAVEWESSSQDKAEFITVPLIDIELSAGNGTPAIVEIEQYELPFRRYTLNKQGVSPSAARVARVIGNSMSPLLNDGDVVGIDTSKTKVIDGDTFAIRDGDLLRVKVLIERPDGGLLIRSFNKDDYPDELLTKEQRQERVVVIGRVWWSSKLW